MYVQMFECETVCFFVITFFGAISHAALITPSLLFSCSQSSVSRLYLRQFYDSLKEFVIYQKLTDLDEVPVLRLIYSLWNDLR